MNTIYLEGRLVKEPDIIWTESGICIANFKIAENVYAGKDEEGKPKYEPIFHKCVAFGPEAEKIGNDSKKVESTKSKVRLSQTTISTKKVKKFTTSNSKQNSSNSELCQNKKQKNNLVKKSKQHNKTTKALSTNERA